MTDKPRWKEVTRGPVSRATMQPTLEDGNARLIMLEGEQLGRRFLLEDLAVLGRDPSCSIVLDDADVSRQHARIRRTERGYSIEDLGSRNGTLVNGIPIQEGALRFGDKIHVGPAVLLLFTRQDALEEQILQRQRLEALGRLSAGVAHDFNNMLGAVASSADYLAGLPPETPLSQSDVLECLADIHLAAKRAGELTRGLLSFARGGRQERARVDIGALCSEVAQLARRTFDRAIRIETQVDRRLVVIGDRIELHQMLMNLCVNARDAMPNGGILRIVAEPSPAKQGGPRLAAAVTVEDAGTGMSADVERRIFEPFFTTKREGAGFGMGLATVAEIVRRHGGKVEVDSRLGEGTRFRIVLPVAERGSGFTPAVTDPPPGMPSTRRGVPSHRNAPARRHARVLLVDDEEVVRRSARRLLRQAGHEVLEARSGRDALTAFRNAEAPVDVVVLDLDMPELNGRETHALMRQIDPDVRVIIVSGHDDEETRRGAIEDGAVTFVRKPYSAEAFLSAIDWAIDGKLVAPRD
jgi:signal transduction histidine kinase/ActR/RegA family two-component response regulator